MKPNKKKGELVESEYKISLCTYLCNSKTEYSLPVEQLHHLPDWMQTSVIDKSIILSGVAPKLRSCSYPDFIFRIYSENKIIKLLIVKVGKLFPNSSQAETTTSNPFSKTII